jgi:hypothetical protein
MGAKRGLYFNVQRKTVLRIGARSEGSISTFREKQRFVLERGARAEFQRSEKVTNRTNLAAINSSKV